MQATGLVYVLKYSINNLKYLADISKIVFLLTMILFNSMDSSSKNIAFKAKDILVNLLIFPRLIGIFPFR